MYGKTRPFRLHFGIPTIDELIGPCEPHPEWDELDETVRKFGNEHRFANSGLNLPRRPKRDNEYRIIKGEHTKAPIASSVNIIGADGSGKSILALHMASAYMLDLVLNNQSHAKVIYASSDLGWERASGTWDTFRLDRPLTRHIPFEIPGWSESPTTLTDVATLMGASTVPDVEVVLSEVQPRHRDFHSALVQENDVAKPNVLFLDLASTTAGDDWGLINRVLGSLEPIDPVEKDGEYLWPHMLIVDAVEGLETIVGNVDAYGLESTRRSRIAQLMQLAAGKCHIVLVNELRHDRDRLDEEFVTDLVVKLKMREKEGYSHRSIEIVKARSQAIIRGEHALTIRGGDAGCTQEDVWPDVPRTHNAYIHCFHGIDARDRTLSRYKTQFQAGPEDAFFGIPYLDDMLGSDLRSGVRRGRLTAILGDEATHKAKLVRSFAANGFTVKGSRELADVSDWEFTIYLTSGSWSKQKLRERLLSHIDAFDPSRIDYPAEVEARIAKRNPPGLFGIGKVHAAIDEHLLVRRLEISTITSNVFAHIVEELVDTAKMIYGQMHPDKKDRPRIRFVIDDLSTIRSLHSVLDTDRKLFPYLVRFLQMEEVTSLIADTHPGRPLVATGGREHHVLQGLADRVVYTWNVPFFNEHRVAITSLSPVSEDSELVVRELKLVSSPNGALLERLEVDPHFELYSDIDQAEPRLVPLQVMLRIQGEASDRYIRETERSLDFNFLHPQDKPSILHLAADQYDELRAMASGRASYRLDQTTVLQLDEFWAHSDSGGLYDLRSYLWEDTSMRIADPTGSFERREDLSRGYTQRCSFFDGPRGSYAAHPITRPNFEFQSDGDMRRSDRTKVIPYYWDLGFMLLDWHVWTSAQKQFDWVYLHGTGDTSAQSEQKREAAYRRDYVSRVQTTLTEPTGPDKPHCSWRRFLRASQFVANSAVSSESHETLAPFDLEMASPESFSSLVLEMWASEIEISSRESGQPVKPEETLFEKVSHKVSDPRGLPDLSEWLRKYSFELYLVWIQLVEVLDAEHFRDDANPFEFANRPARENVVSMRHWYSSAAEFMRGKRGDQYQVARLPGYFTTRGDWFLGIARSSRSRRLGQKAIDQMTTRRANLTRLQQGVGLPVRNLVPDTGQLERSYLRTAIPYLSANGNELMDLQSFLERTCPVETQRERDYAKVCDQSFGWLWRSNLVGYHHDSRIFGKWLFSTLGWMTQIKRKRASGWRNGFRTYDRMRLFGDVCRVAFDSSQPERPEAGTDEWIGRLALRIERHWGDLQDPEIHRAVPSVGSWPLLAHLLGFDDPKLKAVLPPRGGDLDPEGICRFDLFSERLKSHYNTDDGQEALRQLVRERIDDLKNFQEEALEDVKALDSFREFGARCQYLGRLLNAAKPAGDARPASPMIP